MMNISLMNDLMKDMMIFDEMNEGGKMNMMKMMFMTVMKCYKTVQGRKMENGGGVP